MEDHEPSLTPAEQMRRIREAVSSLDPAATQESYAILAAYFSRLDALRERITDAESKMLLREQPFVSHAPVVGRLIVWVRTLWNWMSTKWYALPLIAQQNEFNMALTQTLREAVTAIESQSYAIEVLQMRLGEMEDALNQRMERGIV